MPYVVASATSSRPVIPFVSAAAWTGPYKNRAPRGIRRFPAAATGHEKRLVEMQVKQTDIEIDALVNDLHNLTSDEIAAVETSVGRPSV